MTTATKDNSGQTSIFSDDGICCVCGETVEPTLCDGKIVTLLWCRALCTSIYMSRWMTPKLARFVEEYLIDLNGKQAAIRAGYSPRSAQVIASENLCKPIVKQALSLAILERSQRSKITADKVIEDIEMIKRDAMQRLVTVSVDEDGKVIKSKTMVNHAGALKACELHGRHLKMFTDNVEVNGKHEINYARDESKSWLNEVIEGINAPK